MKRKNKNDGLPLFEREAVEVIKFILLFLVGTLNDRMNLFLFDLLTTNHTSQLNHK